MSLSSFLRRSRSRDSAFRRLAILGALAATSLAGPAFAGSTSGSVALTSDYVWRGSSQTQGDPALQAGISVASDYGLYASAWASNVEFPGTGADLELDLAIGWAGALSADWAMDVGIVHYRYPSTRVDLDWTEINGKWTWRDRYWIAMGWSPEALGADGDGLYTQVGANWQVREALTLELALGHYALEDAYDESYSHAQANLIWQFSEPAALRVSAHASDSAADRLFGDDLAGNRVELAIQATF